MTRTLTLMFQTSCGHNENKFHSMRGSITIQIHVSFFAPHTSAHLKTYMCAQRWLISCVSKPDCKVCRPPSWLLFRLCLLTRRQRELIGTKAQSSEARLCVCVIQLLSCYSRCRSPEQLHCLGGSRKARTQLQPHPRTAVPREPNPAQRLRAPLGSAPPRPRQIPRRLSPPEPRAPRGGGPGRGRWSRRPAAGCPGSGSAPSAPLPHGPARPSSAAAGGRGPGGTAATVPSPRPPRQGPGPVPGVA